MKKKLNTNTEIYNYLNIANRKLGELYKKTGFSPLPGNFDVNEERFKELILLQQMQSKTAFPDFIFYDKKIIKKFFKNSNKNCKKLDKIIFVDKNLSPEFVYNFDVYLDMRVALTDIILKEFSDVDFDETRAYQEIYNLNPVFGELLDKLYHDDVDLAETLTNIEQEYQVSYLEHVQALEKKSNNKRKKESATQNQKSAKTLEDFDIKQEKNLQKTQKIENKKEAKQVKQIINKQKHSQNDRGKA